MKIKCGIEIHQQLFGKKLFCTCPVTTQEKEPHYRVLRRLRAVVGETGEVDAAAAQEAMKRVSYEYECYDECCCLIELDEEPPKKINEAALATAMQVTKLMNAKFVDEVQVMRKTVVDGSNTTGFQRTALVGYNGSIETSQGKVGIPTIIVEEDSAKRIREEKDKVVFRLDRLGTPLLEIATDPDIVSPEHCAEVAEQIGLILKSTGATRRGLGTIRQDVNVSIPGGTRVEVKGAQDLKMIPKIVEVEAQRQEHLLKLRDALKKRNVKKVDATIVDITDTLKNSESKVIKSALAAKGAVLAMKLAGFASLLGTEIQPNRRLGSELSDHAKVVAGVKGLFHSDELPKYGITDAEVASVAKKLKCTKGDAFVLVAAEKDRAERALHAALKRAQQTVKGVPGEVRAANPDGTTRYLRPMPGAARMYPETDVLPIRLTKERIKEVPVPEMIDEKIKRFEKLGLGHDLAEETAKSEYAQLFDMCVKKFKKIKAAYLAEVLVSSIPNIRRQFNVEINPSDEDFMDLFDALQKEKIAKESVLDILKENKPVKEVMPKFALMSDKELEATIKKIIAKNKGAPFNAVIGEVMKELRGKASGKKISELVKKLI